MFAQKLLQKFKKRYLQKDRVKKNLLSRTVFCVSMIERLNRKSFYIKRLLCVCTNYTLYVCIGTRRSGESRERRTKMRRPTRRGNKATGIGRSLASEASEGTVMID